MRKSFVKACASIAAAGLIAMTAACSGGTTSPTAPTAAGPTTSNAPAPAASGATISGTIVGVSAAASVPGLVRPMGATGLTVTVVGTSVSTSVDGAGNFTLTAVPTGDITLRVTGNGVNADVPVSGVSDHETIHITVTVTGSSAELDDDSRETPDNKAEVEGRITAIDATARTVQVAGRTVNIPATVTILHGSTPVAFTDLKVGYRIHARGPLSGTTVVATWVELQSGDPGSGPVVTAPGDDHGGNGSGNGNNEGDKNSVDLKGTVSGLSGSCPALTFTVASTSVTTNGSTKFSGLTCGALTAGTKVEVKGTKQGNGSVLASEVDKE